MSYLVEAHGITALVGGDALFAGGRIMLQDSWDCSVADSCATIRRLAGLDFDWLLPGHGAPVLGEAGSAVAEAMRRVDRFLPPFNLL